MFIPNMPPTPPQRADKIKILVRGMAEISLPKINFPSIIRMDMYKREAAIPVRKPLRDDPLAQKNEAIKPERR